MLGRKGGSGVKHQCPAGHLKTKSGATKNETTTNNNRARQGRTIQQRDRWIGSQWINLRRSG